MVANFAVRLEVAALNEDNTGIFAEAAATLSAITLVAPSAAVVTEFALIPFFASRMHNVSKLPENELFSDITSSLMDAFLAVRTAVTSALLAVKVVVLAFTATRFFDTVMFDARIFEDDTVVPMTSLTFAVVTFVKVVIVADGAVSSVITLIVFVLIFDANSASTAFKKPDTFASFVFSVALTITLDCAVRLFVTVAGPVSVVLPVTLRDRVVVVPVVVICFACNKFVILALGADIESPTTMFEDTSKRSPATVSDPPMVMELLKFMVPFMFIVPFMFRVFVTSRVEMVAVVDVNLLEVRLLTEALERADVLIYAVPPTLKLDATVVRAPLKMAFDDVMRFLLTVRSVMFAVAAFRFDVDAVPAFRLLALALESAAVAAYRVLVTVMFDVVTCPVRVTFDVAVNVPCDCSVFVTVRLLKDPAANERLLAEMESATMVPALTFDSAALAAYSVLPTLRLLATVVTLPLK
jgi:hypothetical protein